MQQDAVLIFLHLPKTAGTTFHHLLEREFANKNHYCAFHNGYKQLNPLRRMSQSERDTIDIVRGHLNYGVHKYFSRPCRYITFLRDPLDRIVSHYAYVRSNRFHPLHSFYARDRFSLRDFIHKTNDNDNGQIRALCGLSNTLSLFDGPRVPFGGIDSSHLRQAIEILEEFTAFGIQEHFDLSLLLMVRKLGIGYPTYTSKNVGNHNGQVSIAPEDQHLICDINRFDIALYEHASRLFKQRVDEQCGIEAVGLPMFRAMNTLYGEYRHAITEHRDIITQADAHREALQHELSKLRQENDELAKLAGKTQHAEDCRNRVSVIIPTYNRAHLIGDAIRSVLAQTYSNFEIIIVDDGSTDNTEEVVSAIIDHRLRYVKQRNRGRSNARNHALSLARGRFIAFLDSDDQYLPEKLERQVEYLRAHPGTGMVYTSAHCIDQQGVVLEHKYRATVSGCIYESIAFFVPVTITLPTVMTYREIMNHVGGFDEAMYRFEDTDMWRRISKVCRIDAMAEFTCLLRTHDDNSLESQNAEQIAAALDYYAQKILREDESIDLAVRRSGLVNLYRYYGHAMLSVPAFEDIGRRLLEKTLDFERPAIPHHTSSSDDRAQLWSPGRLRRRVSENFRAMVYSIGWTYRVLYYRWGLNRIPHYGREAVKAVIYWTGWSFRFIYYRSLNYGYKAYSLIRKLFGRK